MELEAIFHNEDETEIKYYIQKNMQALNYSLMQFASINSISTATTAAVGSLFIYEEIEKLKGFVTILEVKSNIEFFKLLRVTKETFTMLTEKILETGRYDCIHAGGKENLEPKLALCLTLWYLGNQSTYAEIAEQFGLSLSAVHFHVKKIIGILVDMAPSEINWPSNYDQISEETNFRKFSHFPGVIGAIDGCHIKIKAPLDSQKDYLDRNHNHSVNLMAVCDHNKKFTFIYAGFPGSAHDQRVLNYSALGQQFLLDHRPLFNKDFHIIGDSAFVLRPYLIVPFKETATKSLNFNQSYFNENLSSTRRVIENAFAFLKGRFRRLKYIDADLQRTSKIITAACVLHNITLNYPEEIQLIEGELEKVPKIENIVEDFSADETTISKYSESTEAVLKRYRIMTEICENLP